MNAEVNGLCANCQEVPASVNCNGCGEPICGRCYSPHLEVCAICAEEDEQEAHRMGCVCCDCSGAELTADND